VAVPEICCIKQSSNLPIEACSVLEPFGNAVHAVSESNVKNKTVAIFGDGPIGLLAVLVAKAYGASKVFAIGAQDYRLELFKKMQPDYTFDARKVDPVSKIMELTNNEGVDVVLEMSGSEKAIHAGFKVVSPGGTFSFFGIPSKNIELDVADEIIFKGIKINAIVGRRMFKTWNEMAELLNSDSVDISSVITHKFRLEEIDEAMKLLEHDNIRAGKIVLIP